MARKSRMVINRDALHEVDSAMVKGMESMALRVLTEADVPTSDRGYDYIGGERVVNIPLEDRGGFVAYVAGKKVNEFSLLLGERVKKPQGARVRGAGVVVIAGFSFPARFNEMGTARHPARPFLAPALMEVVGDRGAVEDAFYTAARSYLLKKALKLQRKHNTSSGALLGRFR